MYGNPFSDFLMSEEFLPVGRENILDDIGQAITQPNPDDRDLHGLPQMGKTALLHYIGGPNFLKKYRTEFQKPYDEEPYRIFIAFIAGWFKSVHPFVQIYREYFRAYQAYYDTMAAQHPEINLPEPPTIPIRVEDGETAMAFVEVNLRGLDRAGIRAVMLFDEFDSDLAYARLTADETARLAAWKPYVFMILATERRLEDVNAAAKGSPFYKRLPQIAIRDMRPDEARLFVTRVLAAREASLPDADIDRLVRLAGGFPYLLLLAGQALWELRRRIGLQDSPDSLPDAFQPYLENRLADDFRRLFELYFQQRTNAQRQALLDLARRETINMDEAVAATGRQDVLLTSLETYGLVDFDAESRVYRLFSPLFRSFLLAYLDAPAAATAATATAETEPNLTGLQSSLYDVFRSRPGEVLTFEELGRRVWSWTLSLGDEPSESDKRKIHIAVSKLRRELEESDTGERIVNLRALGYRFEPAG